MSMMQGKLNHIESPLAAFIRNLITRYTSLITMRTEKIWDYNVDEEISTALY